MPSTNAGTVPSRLVGAGSAALDVFRVRGAAFVVWTVATGAALAESMRSLFGPEGLSPRSPAIYGRPWLLAAVSVFLLAAVLAAVALVRRRRGNPDGVVALYERALRVVLPAVALPFVIALHEPLERSHPGTVLVIALLGGALTSYSAYAFVSEREASGSRVAVWSARAALAVAVAAYTAYASRITIYNHLNINTGKADLGYYLSIFRQTSQGHLLGCSLCGGGSHLTGHFDPILIPLAPLFLLYPFAETLLVLQTVWLAFGAIPVYVLAFHHLRHRGAALSLAVVYLLYPALHGVNFFDFHSIALSVPLFLWLLCALEKGKRVLYYVAFALVLLVREDMPIALVCVGLYALFSRPKEDARLGWTTIVLSLVYFVVVKALFMHRVDPLNTSTGASGGYAYYYEAMIPAGRSTAALVGTLLSNPGFVLAQVLTDEKVDFVLKLLVPLFGLPLFARGRFMLAYGAALTLLASRPYLFSIHFQYTSVLIPFLFALAMSALGRIYRGELFAFGASGPRLARSFAFGMLVTTVLCTVKFGGLLPNASFMGGFRPLSREYNKDHFELAAFLKKVALTFPRGSRVAGNSRLVTHLGAASSILMLDERQNSDFVVVNVDVRPFGPRIVQEAQQGDLALVASHPPVNVYKTQYKTRGKKDATSEAE